MNLRPKKKEKPGDSRIANTKQAKNTVQPAWSSTWRCIEIVDSCRLWQRLIELKDAVSLLTE